MKEAEQNRGANRREFMRDGFRYALLTGLAAVSTALFKRSGGQLSGQTCSNQGICSNCTVFAGCGLPQALSAKEYQERRGQGEAAQSSRKERGLQAASSSHPEPPSKPTEVRISEEA